MAVLEEPTRDVAGTHSAIARVAELVSTDPRFMAWQVTRPHRGDALVDARQLRLRADRGVAMARKMLGRGQHARGVDSVHDSTHV